MKSYFETEKQEAIAMEGIRKAYIKKYGKIDSDFNDIVSRMLAESDPSAFEGTDEEIAKMWSEDTDMF